MGESTVPANLKKMDPQARALLDRMAADGAKPLLGLSPQEARRVFTATRTRYQPSMARVRSCQTRALPGAPEGVRVRIYKGVGDDGEALQPIFLFFHGGGWMAGDLDSYDALCARIANEASCHVISVDYRLAPENPFPAALDDAVSALQWLCDAASELQMDSSRIAIGGDSAGANLAAALAVLSRDGQVPSIMAQVLIYPCTDLSMTSPSFRQNWTGAPLTSESMANYISGYTPNPKDREDWRASPLRAKSLAGVAPALVVSAGIDPLRDDAFAYSARLQDHGAAVTHLHYSDQFHGFLPMWHVIDAADRAMAFLVSHLAQSFERAGA